MLKNYFRIAWRNMVRNKAFSAINILGLALGIASSLLIFLWVNDEMGMDRYHRNGPYIYNVMERQKYDGKFEVGTYTPGMLWEELKKKVPEIIYAVGYTNWTSDLTFAAGDRINKEKGGWAGADWFRMFSVPLLAGKPETALEAPNSLAISRKVAETFFGAPDAAIGKSIRVDNEKDYMVTAVFENLPEAASWKYDFLLSFRDYIARNEFLKDWGNNSPATTIQLRPDADAAKVEAKIRHFLKGYNPYLDKTFDIELFLQPYEDAYLYSRFKDGQQQGGRIEYARLFTVVAVFLLLIACINFMNLATARSVKRAREVGVRKVVGAMRGLLVGQFMGEALLFTLLALLAGLVIVGLLTPSFNVLTGKHIRLPFTSGAFWLMLGAITLFTGLMAGSYPALFLSSLRPVRVLKGTLKFGAGARRFRQGLVVFQFALSMLLIVGTLIIYRQIGFIQSSNLGYDRENIIYVAAEGKLGGRYPAFKDALLAQPGIQAVTTIEESPTRVGSNTFGLEWPGKDPNAKIGFYHTAVGYDFAKTLKVQVQGREFSPSFGTDTVNYLVNETAARRMGLNNPVGTQISMWGRPGKIIGVMKDFHFQSLHSTIGPLVLYLTRQPYGDNILVRAAPGQTKQVLAGLEKVWEQFNPEFPFIYNFLDEQYQQLYKSEMVVGRLANYFAGLAIFISCLGLLGLSAFTAEQRTKEIGIRKVLGASVQHVVVMLSKDFLKLVLLAIVIASPLAWYAMNRWLQHFAYHIDLEWWMFTLAGLLAVGIALFTISFQSVKAALMNPVSSLRSE